MNDYVTIKDLIENEFMRDYLVEPLIFEPEDWTEEEWKTILKIFNMKKADRIVLDKCRISAFGVKNGYYGCAEDWHKLITKLLSIKGAIMLEKESGNCNYTNLSGRTGVEIDCDKLWDEYKTGNRSKEFYAELSDSVNKLRISIEAHPKKEEK